MIAAPESVSVPLTSVTVPALLRTVALLSVNAPSMVMREVELLVRAPVVASVAVLAIEIVPAD